MKNNYSNTYSFDAISIHEYCAAINPDVADANVENKSWLDHGKTLNSIMGEYGITDKERIISEAGYRHSGTLNETNSAIAKIRMLALDEMYDLYDKFFFYEAIDGGIDTAEKEHNFGLTKSAEGCRTPYAAKESYLAVANYNNLLGNARFVTKPEETFGGIDTKRVAEFLSPEGKTIYMAWTQDGKTTTRQVSAPTGYVKVYDMYGNAEYLTASGGTYTASLSLAPIYIEVVSESEISAFKNGKQLRADDSVTATDKITVKLSSSSAAAKQLLYATYKNNVLVDAEVKAVATKEDSLDTDLPNTADSFKVFVFDGLDTLKPLCDKYYEYKKPVAE